MKIAMVFDQMLWGGAERVGISYSRIFTELGHDVEAFVLNPETESIIEELKSICKVHVLDLRKTSCPENQWSIIQYQDRHNLEIILFSMVFIGLSIKNKLLKRKYRINTSFDLAIAFSGHINDLTFVANDFIQTKYKMAWLHGTQSSYNMLSPGFFRLYRKIGNLVCLSDLGDIECETFNKKYHITKRKMYNPCVVNEADRNPQKIERLKKCFGPYCLMVARLAPDKDQETAIKAMHYLHREYGIEKHLLLVGEGDRKKQLEELVRDLHMEKWVHFEGSRKDVVNYYLSAQILIHAAPLEGLPTVFLEAMHYGLPIATTDAFPGAREILGNNEYGLISPVNSPKELAKNIKKLYDDSHLREEYIEKGKDRIKAFMPDVIKNQIVSLLDYTTSESV